MARGEELPKGLANLRALGLGETQVTDAGLEHLKGCGAKARSLYVARVAAQTKCEVATEHVLRLHRAGFQCQLDW